jgi:hypothetical protein
MQGISSSLGLPQFPIYNTLYFHNILFSGYQGQGYHRIVNTTDPTRALSDEQRLLYYIMTNYENSVRPVQNASQTVNIDLGITLNQIFDVVSNH